MDDVVFVSPRVRNFEFLYSAAQASRQVRPLRWLLLPSSSAWVHTPVTACHLTRHDHALDAVTSCTSNAINQKLWKLCVQCMRSPIRARPCQVWIWLQNGPYFSSRPAKLE